MKFEELLQANKKDVLSIGYKHSPITQQMAAVSSLIKVCTIDGEFSYFAYEIFKITYAIRLFTDVEDFVAMDGEQYDTIIANGVHGKILNGVAKSDARYDYKKFVEICDKIVEDNKGFVAQMQRALATLQNIPKENLDTIQGIFQSDKFQKDVTIKQVQKDA